MKQFGRIEMRLELEAPPERVWRALTDARELSQWFPDDGAELEARDGGAGWFTWKGHGRFAVAIEIFDPPRRLSWRWARKAGTPLSEGPSTLVEWTLTPRPGGGTVLELRESGFADAKHLEDNTGGWKHELGQLVEHLRQAA